MNPTIVAAIIGAIATIVAAYISRGNNSSSPKKGTPPRPGKKTHWYDKTGWLVFWMVIFWPVGLYGIYRSRAVKKGWKILASGIIPFALSLILLTPSVMKSTWAYQEAIELARQNPVVVAELGEPLETGWFVSGSVSIRGSSGEADLSIPISGPKNRGTIIAVAAKQWGKWKFELVEMNIKGREESINLLTQ